MDYVYPRVTDPDPIVTPIDDETLASRIVTCREEYEEMTREKAVGLVLQGEGTVADFNRVWDEVEAERQAWRAVNPADYDTVTKFKAALTGKYLDSTVWYDGLMAEAGVSSFAELKAAFTPQEL